MDFNEKIDEKLDRVESKLSYLSNQVLVISANEDKFKYPRSSFDPSAYYQTKGTSHGDSELQSILKDATFYGQDSRYSRIIDRRQTATTNTNTNTIKAEDSETKSIPTIDTSSFYQPKPESTIATTPSSIPPNNKSYSEISTSNKPTAVETNEPATDFLQKSNEFTGDTARFDHSDHIGKNTNPEIDKIEKEILTALKRLGGNVDDYGDLKGYNDSIGDKEDIIYPAVKKTDRKVKNFD